MSSRITAIRRIALLLALLCGAWPLAAGAQGMHMGGMGDEPQLGAGAAFGTGGRLWLATVHAGHVVVRHSDDFGKTLSKPATVNPVAEAIYDSGENHPKVAIGPRGQVYVTWSHPLAHHLYSGYVRFSRSLDGGEHFSAPITVNHDLAPITHRIDALAVAGNGDVVVAWIYCRDEVAAEAAGKPYRGKALYYTWSRNEGTSFAPDHKLTDHSCECCQIALARQPNGDVAGFFRMVYPGEIRDHAMAVLRTDGKPDDPKRATFSNWKVAACPHQGLGLAIGREGVLHGVWFEAAHGPAVWYGRLDPGHPPLDKLKLGGLGASHADVAVHDQTVWVTWNQVNAHGYTLMLRVSRDDGLHFGEPRPVATSSAAVYSPQLLTYAGKAYVAWNTADGFRLIPAGAE